MSRDRNGRVKAYIKLILLLAIPVFLLFLPANYFDNGESLCPSKQFLDIECLGCGLTRGIQHLIHLDFKTAWSYNKLSPFILIIAIYYWCKWLINAYKATKTAP